MTQLVLLGIVFGAALFYLGRYIYRQVKTGDDEGYCDKCLPKEKLNKVKNGPR